MQRNVIDIMDPVLAWDDKNGWSFSSPELSVRSTKTARDRLVQISLTVSAVAQEIVLLPGHS